MFEIVHKGGREQVSRGQDPRDTANGGPKIMKQGLKDTNKRLGVLRTNLVDISRAGGSLFVGRGKSLMLRVYGGTPGEVP